MQGEGEGGCCLYSDVAIIGGGLAGLTLAALLAQRGQRVAVYEADRLGGKLRRLEVGGLSFDTGPSLFTFPGVWHRVLARLHEHSDPLNLRLLPGGLGIHHTPFGPVPLPVPPGHALYADWLRVCAAAAPVAPHLEILLTTPPRLTSAAFLRASAALARATGPHLTAEGWIRARRVHPALAHALRTHALNAGLPPADAPALYALLPALMAEQACRPAEGMGVLLDTLHRFCAARGVQFRGAELSGAVRRLDAASGTLTLDGGEVAQHDLLISAIDPARLAALRGLPVHSPVAQRTVSGVAVYAAFSQPVPLPATSILPPTHFATFRAAMRVGTLPPDTLALIHADGPRLAVLLTAPATARPLTPDHSWVRAQLARVETALGVPGLLASAVAVTALDPAHYAQGGHPGGAIYGLGFPAWRGGPLHPQPYRLHSRLWQVGTGVHPGGGIPAILGGALIVDELLADRSK
ncbi:phytoene desaturase family protein [Deinococcus oregonensis]|uniref:Phytoene desaturase family protein n=1 Tax=Deinococcus oregonensis TaxID=1805970 RepID=A0ABV6B3C6_9DEIO